MKYIISLLVLLVTCSSSAQNLPYNGFFMYDNLQINFEGEKFKTGINQSAGHLGSQGHNILRVFEDNPYLAYPFFDVGVIDNGIYLDHEDFHDYVTPVNSTFDSGYHGTGVSSLFSSSKIANDLGTHGIINGRTFFNDYSLEENNYQVKYVDMLKAPNSNIKVITQSMALEYLSTYAYFEGRGSEGNKWPILESSYTANHEIARVKAVASLRKYFLANPDILFILAAGNSAQNALKNNGAVHFVYEAMNFDILYSEIPNVIVVGAVGFDSILHHYSDFGTSVDLAGISGLHAARCTDNGKSYYYFDNEEYTYGIFSKLSDFPNASISDEKSPCDVDNVTNATMNGTSAAAPVIAGLAAVLQNMDNSLTPAEIKNYLVNNTVNFATMRHNLCTESEKDCELIQSLAKLENIEANIIKGDNGVKSHIPIPNLFNTYTQLKIDIQKEVSFDVAMLLNKGENISNTNDCTIFWQQNNAERDAIGSKKSYEALFYGNKCLYFRGNSFIIEYDIPSKLAKSLYYGDAHYDEYQTVRKFINNMKSAKTDETWRQGYGVGLNSSGNVACLSADGSACTQPLTTPQQCENIWEALTGTKPQIHDIVPLIFEEDSCFYLHVPEYNHLLSVGVHRSTILKEKSINQRYLSYNSKINQEQIVANVRSNNHSMFDLILQFIRIKRDYNYYTGIMEPNKNYSLRLFSGIPLCSPEFDSGCISRTDFNKTESYAHCKSMVQLFSREDEELKYDYIKTPTWCKILYDKGEIHTRKEVIFYRSPLGSQIVFMMHSDNLMILDRSGYNQ